MILKILVALRKIDSINITERYNGKNNNGAPNKQFIMLLYLVMVMVILKVLGEGRFLLDLKITVNKYQRKISQVVRKE